MRIRWSKLIAGVMAAVMIGLLAWVPLTVQAQSIDELHNAGVQLYNQGQYEAAAEKFVAALKINPRALAPLDYLGGSLVRLERYPDAEDVLKQTLQVNPYDADALYDLAVAYDHLDQLDLATTNYQKAIEEYTIRPQSLNRIPAQEVYNNLGIAQLANQNLSSALTSFKAATQLDPNYGQGFYLQGLTYTQSADYPKATQAFSTSVSPEVKFDFRERGYNGRGVSLFLDGKSDEALSSLNQSIQEADRQTRTYPVAYANRGLTYFDKGDLQNAEKDYQTTTQLAPDDANGFRDSGTIKFQIAQTAARISRATDPVVALAELPSSTQDYFQIQALQIALQQQSPAQQPLLAAALPLVSDFWSHPSPTDPSARIRVAFTQIVQTKLQEASKFYQQALVLDGSLADAHYGLAAVLRSQQQFQSALQEFQQAKTLYEKNNNLKWVSFTQELDIPSIQARLAEPILPQDRIPLPSAKPTGSDPSLSRSGFSFTQGEVVKFLDANQLDRLTQLATTDTTNPIERREAIHALRLKRYRSAYPALQNRLAKGSQADFKEADRGVRSAILYFLEEVEPLPPPMPQARVPIGVSRPVIAAAPRAPNPVQPRPVRPVASQSISVQKVKITFAPPVKVAVAGCGDGGVVSQAICRIRT